MFKETVSEWVNDKAPRLGASLAFYTQLSLAPLLIVIVAVAALVYGQEAARHKGLCGYRDCPAVPGLVNAIGKPGAPFVASELFVYSDGFPPERSSMRPCPSPSWWIRPDSRNALPTSQ